MNKMRQLIHISRDGLELVVRENTITGKWVLQRRSVRDTLPSGMQKEFFSTRAGAVAQALWVLDNYT